MSKETIQIAAFAVVGFITFGLLTIIIQIGSGG